MSAERSNPVILIVNGDEQHVRPPVLSLGRAGAGSHDKQQTDEQVLCEIQFHFPCGFDFSGVRTSP
jgi:hypothetical protein